MASPEWPAPMMTTVVRTSGLGRYGRRCQATATVDVGGVGHDVVDRRALLGLGHDRLDVGPGGVGVDVEADPDSLEAVADVGVGAEDAEHVHVALDGGGDRSELDLAVLSHGGDAGGEAAGQSDEHVLDRRGAEVLRGEALRVIDFEPVRRSGGSSPARGRRTRRRSRCCGCRAPTRSLLAR